MGRKLFYLVSDLAGAFRGLNKSLIILKCQVVHFALNMLAFNGKSSRLFSYFVQTELTQIC
jgi:hypothetical protein